MIMRRRFFKKSSSVNIENYMTIEALEDGITVTFTHTGVLKNERCEYSINGGVWKVLLVGISSPAINKGETISFKANGFNSSGIDNVTGVVSVSGSFNLKGNVLSMCYGDNAESEDSIGDNSFAGMFLESDVVSVSENFLPATTLASNCYDSMFYYCQKLTQAPKLPATTLAVYCYKNMFYSCKNLNYIKMLATDISANDCLSSWVYDVSPTGTFVKSKDATWDVTGVSGVPTGWTVITDDQESGGGEVNLISFTMLEGLTIGSKVEYNAIEGMTWREWVDSEYNTRGYYIESDSIKIDTGLLVVSVDNGRYVTANEVIVSKKYGWAL